MTIHSVSNKGWVVIPAELRRKYGLKPGAEVRYRGLRRGFGDHTSHARASKGSCRDAENRKKNNRRPA